MTMLASLSVSEMDQILHHFTEESNSRGCPGVDSWRAVEECHENLSTVKSRTILGLMNTIDQKSALPQQKTFNPGCVTGQLPGVGSMIVATVVDVTSVANSLTVSAIDKEPTHVKIPLSVNGMNHAVQVIPDIMKALLHRDNVWQGSRDLKQAIYDVVFSAGSIPSWTKWKIASDGKSISVSTASGLHIQCAHLHDNSSNIASHESDHTFSRRTMCQRVTQNYSSQPLIITAHTSSRVSQVLRACVYPCSKTSSGLLMATTHLSGYERPLRSCALVIPCSLRRHASFGVHEADVSTLITPFVRTHVQTLAELYSKCAIMKVVLQEAAPTFELSRLGDMDELELHTQYTRLRGLCTSAQLKLCANTWAETKSSDAMRLTCISGTINAFQNDAFHTDVATHTRSIMDMTFTYEGDVHHMSSPIVVSLYGTYYHHM